MSLVDGMYPDGEAPDVDDEILAGGPIDVTPEVDPEDFDFDAFVDGVRPGRRAVRVYSRADLMAERDQLALDAQELPDDDEETAEAMLDRFRELSAQILATSKVFVVEARTDTRAKAIQKQIGPEPGKKATQAERDAWTDRLLEARLADSIVVPSNVTPEGIAKLRKANEAEFAKLWNAFTEAMTNPTRGLTTDPNFSLRR